MAKSMTLTFESARQLSEMFGGDSRLLRLAEKVFAVEITTRDAWLKIDGSDQSIECVKTVFDQLQKAVKNGMVIRQHEFGFIVHAVKEGRSHELSGLWQSAIRVSAKKQAIVPKTFTQREYLQKIGEHDLVFGLGAAGTGKTFLAVAAAVEALKANKVGRIILTRPAVEAGEALGFLPGDMQEKLYPYLRPLYDALYDILDRDEVQKLVDRGLIEVAPLAYMRGRTLAKAFVILDEAQNATTEQMFMFLTRLGQGAKCVVTGDMTQIDLPKNKKSGLIEAIQALQNIEGSAFVRFQDSEIVRHELVSKIVSAYKRHRGEKQTSMQL
ncbi:MAG: PhoH family protein [Verrucomicrobiota bacterium]